jgi:hypothetical protein
VVIGADGLIRSELATGRDAIQKVVSSHAARPAEPGKSWPQAVQDAAGAIPDFPDVAELRKGYGADAKREQIE